MAKEEKDIIVENVKKFRHLLNEAVSEASIIDAINKRKIVTIFYVGEDTQNKGYRTIQPHVLGISKTKNGTGNLVVRAWQENGDSDTFMASGARRDHEYFITNQYKPGWRLFRLDGIKSMSVTGDYFKVDETNQRPLYKPNDKGMSSIIASVNPLEKTVDIKQDGVIQNVQSRKKNLNQKELQKLAKDQQQNIGDIIIDLYRIATRHKKEKTADKIVVFRNNDFFTDFEKNRNKYKPQEILGNLKQLYDKYYSSTKDKLPKEWIVSKKNEFKKQIQTNNNVNNNQKNNLDKKLSQSKTDFKNQIQTKNNLPK